MQNLWCTCKACVLYVKPSMHKEKFAKCNEPLCPPHTKMHSYFQALKSQDTNGSPLRKSLSPTLFVLILTTKMEEKHTFVFQVVRFFASL
jgi:hypothetical protein